MLDCDWKKERKRVKKQAARKERGKRNVDK
jgi:hypothetical protein